MSDVVLRDVQVRLVADVSAFRRALRRFGASPEPWAIRCARIRRMHTAYSRRRGRGRW